MYFPSITTSSGWVSRRSHEVSQYHPASSFRVKILETQPFNFHSYGASGQRKTLRGESLTVLLTIYGNGLGGSCSFRELPLDPILKSLLSPF